MKWIHIPINFPSFQDLVQQARDYMRRNLVTVNKFPVDSKYKYLDRTVTRPWHILPSIQGFRIVLSPNDWLLTLFGLKKRFPNRMTFDTWKNDDSNGYIEYMFERLSKEVTLKKFNEAAATLWILMNSSAYQACALNHVSKNWHRKLPINQVLHVMKEVKRLVKSKETRLKYARVYLQEKNKLRPLGVPALSWRVYLHMYNNCIVQWRLCTEGNKQHGYLPGRGLITAWREITKRLNSPHIFEADFKGFFNNVTHKGLHKVLTEELGFPISEANWIKEVNKSPVKLTKEDKIPEPDRAIIFDTKGVLTDNAKDNQFEFNDRLVKGWEGRIPGEKLIIGKEADLRGLKTPDPNSILTMFQGMATLTPIPDARQGDINALSSGFHPDDKKAGDDFYERAALYRKTATRETIAMSWGISPDRPSVQWLEKDKGVPQGAPTSCSLATLALRSLESKYDVIIYADDIIYFPTTAKCNPLKDLEDTFYGIEVNHEKSKWLKQNGVWLVESFKFLGIRYFPESTRVVNVSWFARLTLQGITTTTEIVPPRFIAETRKGANLEFTDRESLLSYLAIARELLLDSKYLQRRFKHYSLEKWLITRFSHWNKLNNKAKLLFGEAIVIGGDIVSPDYYYSLSGIIKRWLQKEKGVLHYENPLTGYLLSRMHSNSWFINTKQDFTLTYCKNSWIATAWERYSLQWIVPRSRLNVFTASSFAIHDLIDYLSRGSIRRRKRKPIIRKVYSKTKSPSWVLEVLKMKKDLNLTSFKDNVPFNAPVSSRSPDALKSVHLDIIRPILLLFISLDLIIGFPLMSFLYLWSSRRTRIIVSAEMKDH